MNVFSEREQAYLGEQRLGRLATVGEDGQPHVVPVGFRYNAETGMVEIGGHNLAATKKFRDARSHPQVALVVDDLASVDPWRPRGIEVRGHATTFDEGGERAVPGFAGAWIRIRPTRIVSWGLDGSPFKPNRRSVARS